MGVSLYVESLRTHERLNSPWEHQRQAKLDIICAAFNWEKVPWKEPSQEKGLGTSLGATRYNYVLEIAWVVEYLNGEWENYIEEIIGLVQSPRRINDLCALLNNHSKRFAHLLYQDVLATYRNIYLPVEFAIPIYTEVPVFGWSGLTDEREAFAFASSVNLANELAELEPVIKQIVSLKGADTPVSSENSHTWEGVLHACQVLEWGARDSIRVNLPFIISY